MNVIKNVFCFLMFAFCSSVAFSQESKSIVHIKFDLSENKQIQSPPGHIGDSISYLANWNLKTGEKAFRIWTIELHQVNKTVEPLELEKKDVSKMSFKPIKEMLLDWEKSGDLFATKLYDEIYVYEFLADNCVLKWKVYWAGGFEN